MQILLSKTFKKQLEKLPAKLRTHCAKRFKLFIENPSHPLLHKHALSGKYADHFSINITGDYHAVYFPIDNSHAMFIAIGSHSQLYS